MRMLKNTLILPSGDADLAATQLEAAIMDLRVVLMLVFGSGDESVRVVEIGDQLCDKTSFGVGNLRRVVWIRDTPDEVLEVVRGIKGLEEPTELPLVAVINFHDALKTVLHATDFIDPLELELAFLKGEQL